MKDKMSSALKLLLDASEYLLYLVTMTGAVIALIYCLNQLISGSSREVILSIACAVTLLAINVFMRTGHARQ